MTKERKVVGLIMDEQLHMVKSKIRVLITADEKGESISFSSDDLGLMIQVPLETIEDMMKWAVEQ